MMEAVTDNLRFKFLWDFNPSSLTSTIKLQLEVLLWTLTFCILSSKLSKVLEQMINHSAIFKSRSRILLIICQNISSFLWIDEANARFLPIFWLCIEFLERDPKKFIISLFLYLLNLLLIIIDYQDSFYIWILVLIITDY